MNDYYDNRIFDEASYFSEREMTKKEKKFEWLEIKIPLHFVLLFCIFVFGSTVFISNKNTFFVEAGKFGAAALEPIKSESPAIEDKDQDLIKTGVLLPISNNKGYALPLSENREQKEEQKLRAVYTKLDQADYPEIKINRDDYKDGKVIDVDLTKQIMSVYGFGELKGLYKVSTGMTGMKTPIGKFKISRKSAFYWSNACSCRLPYAMEFFAQKGLFIHELPYFPEKGQEGAASLGNPVSHGCVRLGTGDAKEVYDFAEIGTPVIIHN